MEVFLFVAGLILGWLLGGIHVYNREIDILNGFRKRVEDIEAKYIEDYKKLEEQMEHEEN